MHSLISPATQRTESCQLPSASSQQLWALAASTAQSYLQVKVLQVRAVLQQQGHKVSKVTVALAEVEALQGEVREMWLQEGLQELHAVQAAC